MLLWLWCRLAGAAPIGPLAWDPPYAMRAALKRPKKKKKSLETKPAVTALDNEELGSPVTAQMLKSALFYLSNQ